MALFDDPKPFQIAGWGLTGVFLSVAMIFVLEALHHEEALAIEAERAAEIRPQDLVDAADAQEQALYAWGWKDQGAGRALVPIDVAIELTAKAQGH